MITTISLQRLIHKIESQFGYYVILNSLSDSDLPEYGECIVFNAYDQDGFLYECGYLAPDEEQDFYRLTVTKVYSCMSDILTWHYKYDSMKLSFELYRKSLCKRYVDIQDTEVTDF